MYFHLSVASWWCCCWSKRSARSPASLSSASLCSTSLKDPKRKKCHLYDIRLLKDNAVPMIRTRYRLLSGTSRRRLFVARHLVELLHETPLQHRFRFRISHYVKNPTRFTTEIRARWERSISLPLIAEIFTEIISISAISANPR